MTKRRRIERLLWWTPLIPVIAFAIGLNWWGISNDKTNGLWAADAVLLPIIMGTYYVSRSRLYYGER